VHERVQRLVSVVKMATVIEECTTEEQRSAVRHLWTKVSLQRIFTKKCLLDILGIVCRVKRFTTGSRNSLKDEGIETEVRKWLRQQSKDLYVVGFNALVNRWDKCINAGGGYVEK
jgi:hypothetical protein